MYGCCHIGYIIIIHSPFHPLLSDCIHYDFTVASSIGMQLSRRRLPNSLRDVTRFCDHLSAMIRLSLALLYLSPPRLAICWGTYDCMLIDFQTINWIIYYLSNSNCLSANKFRMSFYIQIDPVFGRFSVKVVTRNLKLLTRKLYEVLRFRKFFGLPKNFRNKKS